MVELISFRTFEEKGYTGHLRAKKMTRSFFLSQRSAIRTNRQTALPGFSSATLSTQTFFIEMKVSHMMDKRNKV